MIHNYLCHIYAVLRNFHHIIPEIRVRFSRPHPIHINLSDNAEIHVHLCQTVSYNLVSVCEIRGGPVARGPPFLS